MDRINDLPGITAPGDRLEMRSDIMMVDLPTDVEEDRLNMRRKANREHNLLRDIIGP